MSKEIKEFVEAFIKQASENLGSKEDGEAFVYGFIKESAGPELFEPFPHMGNAAAKALGAAGVGLALGALAGRVGGMFDSVERSKMHTKFQSALTQVKSSNRIVKAADQSKVNSYAETIFKFAPHVAGDPNVLASLLANIVQGESIDPMTVKMLVELEGRYKENAAPAFIKP